MIKDLCRIGADMSKKRWKLWAIPGFLGLLALTLLTRCNPIENDLQQRSQTLLNDQGMNWAKTELDGRGRDLLLTGVAPSETAKNKAIELTEGVYGVRTVDHDIIVKEYVTSVFSLQHTDDTVTLTGSLPDQATINQTISQAQSLYGKDKVTSLLRVNELAKQPDWLAGATGLMATMAGAQSLAIDATDKHINITGTVPTEAAKASLLEQATASFGDAFSESIEVVAVGPTPEELAAIEAARLAEEQRLAAEAEAARIAEEQRLAAAEAEAARIAEEKRLAAEAEAARIAEKKRLAAEAIRIAKQKRKMLTYCELKLNRLVNDNPSIFDKDSAKVRGNSYGLLGMITVHVNACSDLLHEAERYITVAAQASPDDTAPLSPELGMARTQAFISYLENISGIHPGLLIPVFDDTAETNQQAQFKFTMTK